MRFESVEDFLEEYGVEIDYKKGNKENFMICCPFHDDSNPSCSVHKIKGLFHCFSCGESGNIYKLVSKVAEVSYQQAQKMWDGEQAIEFNRKIEREEVIDWYEKYYNLKSIVKLLLYPSNWTTKEYEVYGKYAELVVRQKYFEDGTLLNTELQMKRVLLEACDQQLWDDWTLYKSDNFNYYERFVSICKGTKLEAEIRIAINIILEGFLEDTEKLNNYYIEQLEPQREIKQAPEGMTLEECIRQNWT